MLTISLWGFLIRKMVKRLPYFKIRLDSHNPYISDKTAAKIFWNLYERAEAELIQKYLPGDKPVVELGASLGVISSLIGTKIRPNILLCVEPNPQLIPSIQYCLNQIPNLNYKIYPNIISYQDAKVGFHIATGDNLIGRINSESDLKIDSISVAELIHANDIQSFDMVFDIEGAEVEILLYEHEVWQVCRMVICELHETIFRNQQFSVQRLKQMIESKGFTCLEQNGNCFAFLNSRSFEPSFRE